MSSDRTVINYVPFQASPIASDLLPASNNVYKIGSPSLQWANIYSTALTISSTLNISSTTDSTSTTTGAMVCAGGIGVAKSMYVGGILNITDTTSASSSTTGSIVTAGGIGVAINIVSGTTIEAGTNFLGKGINIQGTGGISLGGSGDSTTINIGQTSSGGRTINIGTSSQANIITMGTTGNASASTTINSGTDLLLRSANGSVVASGAPLVTTSTTNATSSTTGALMSSGGCGIAMDLYVGGIFDCVTMKRVTVSLSSADIKQLKTVGKTIIPAPGAGLHIVPYSVFASYKFVTTAYTVSGGNNILICYAGAPGSPSRVVQQGFLVNGKS